jgi:Flp pilus assembly protein TadG
MTTLFTRARTLLSGRRVRSLARSERGQSLVELALFLPLIAFFGLACVQFAVLFLVYINVMNTTRDAARWISVHPNVIDTTNLDLVRTRLPSSISSAALQIDVNPTCTTVSNGKCTTRPPGTQISVASTYNISSHLFLPTSFGYGTFIITTPTTLPTYTIFMQVEPN